jgi:hypothetical protein
MSFYASKVEKRGEMKEYYIFYNAGFISKFAVL